MKSLDDLICYLLEQVALCGKQGASPSHILECIESFYTKTLGGISNEGCDENASSLGARILIDRPFQEQIWKWLVGHPDCRVEKYEHSNQLILSEFENPNLISSSQGAVPSDTLHLQQNAAQTQNPGGNSDQSNKIGDLHVRSGADESIQRQRKTFNKQSSSSQGTTPPPQQGLANQRKQLLKIDESLRVYVSEARIWQAIAGHGPDHSRIPQLDFDCLSIIAAAGPKGILQTELVKISKQDKRSVPRRTQLLSDKGYVVKYPVINGRCRTSLCILMNFVRASPFDKLGHESAEAKSHNLDNISQLEFEQCFQKDNIDLGALLRNIFHGLSRLKIIAIEDLRRKLGVVGLSREGRLVAETLRKLEAVGCIKRVKAQDSSLDIEPKYFKCVKLIREPGEKDLQQILGSAHSKIRLMGSEYTENVDHESEPDEDHQSLHPSDLRATEDEPSAKTVQSHERPIPQWTGAGSINNFLYDLVHKSGTRGMSTMEIKDLSLGKYFVRPVDHHLSRIVDLWQSSQPAHLRHLAILRDTAIVKRSMHFVHYTYDNFEVRVNNGHSQWEAVASVVDAGRKSTKVGVAFTAEPNLDEYGFPELQPALFEDRENTATLSHCVDAISVASNHLTEKGLGAKELAKSGNDGYRSRMTQGYTYMKPEGPHAVRKERERRSRHALSGETENLPKVSRPRGRPPKIPRTSPLAETTSAQKAKLVRPQKPVSRYEPKNLDQQVSGGDKLGKAKQQTLQCSFKSRRPAISTYFPSIVAHSQLFLNDFNSFSDQLDLAGELCHTSAKNDSKEQTDETPPIFGLEEATEKTYAKQSSLIERATLGIFVGETAMRARFKGQRGRSKKCRLVIIKSPRLYGLKWFTEYFLSPPSKKVTGHDYEGKPGLEEEPSHSYSPLRIEESSPTLFDIESSKLLPTPISLTNGSTSNPISSYTEDPDKTKENRIHTQELSGNSVSNLSSSGKIGVLPDLNLLANRIPEFMQKVSPFTPINKAGLIERSEYRHVKEPVQICDASLDERPRSRSSENTSFPTFHEERPSNEGQLLRPFASSSQYGISPTQLLGEIPYGSSEDLISKTQGDPASSSTYKIVSDGPPKRKPIKPKPQVIRPVVASGGSMGILRRKIIMDIMQLCDGVYSGSKELVTPFISAWRKQSNPGKPDAFTVYKAVRSLVQSSKLREIVFSFQTPQGLMVTRSMITTSDISPTDPRVIKMQKAITSAHPSYYIPKEVEITEGVRSSDSYFSKAGVNQGFADLEIDNKSQVRLQHKPLYVLRMQNQKATAQENRKITEATTRAVGEKGLVVTEKSAKDPSVHTTIAVTPKRSMNLGKLPLSEEARNMESSIHRHHSKPIVRIRKIERLASIRRPAMKELRTSQAAPVAKPSYPIQSYFDLSSLPDIDLDSMHEGSGNNNIELIDAEESSNIREPPPISKKRIRRQMDGSFLPEQYKRKRRRHHTTQVRRRASNLTPKWHESSTMMNPSHHFHSPTGTFSVTFLGFGGLIPRPLTSSGRIIAGQDKTKFEAEVDDLLKWELMTKDVSHCVYQDWPFVNHTLQHVHRIPSDLRFQVDASLQVSPPEKDMPEPKRISSALRKAQAVEKSFNAKLPSVSPFPGNQPLKRKYSSKNLAFKTRPLTSRVETDEDAEYHDAEATAQQSRHDVQAFKKPRIRGPHKQTPMTLDDEERLLAAVIAIRTLTGGLEKTVDWVLVTRLFQPRFSQMYIQKRWTQVQHRYRLQLDQIQAKFQARFIKAYEDGAVAPIDFDNLVDYDWPSLIDWTLENIDTSTDSLQHLPAERSELEDIFHIQSSGDVDIPEFYEIDSTVTTQRREAILSRRPYVYPGGDFCETPLDRNSREIAVARTWIRANVITSEETYDPERARSKLSSLGETNIDIALQELLTARMLSQQNKGRLVPGRNYDISEYFLSRLRKKIDVSQFHRAAAFKHNLDEELSKQESVVLSYAAANGDMIAVLNMAAHQRITIKPKNPPMEKFGLTDGGYMTRRMDKSRLNFDVELCEGINYIQGNPLSPLPPPPCQHLEDPTAKIPLWYDIHGKLVKVMWAMALAATMTVLAMRPGVTALEIESSVKPSLEIWELNLILDWMVQAKVAKITGRGFVPDEWWWMCLGHEDFAELSRPVPVPEEDGVR